MLTVILTGGSSRRMGRDKALLPYGESTLQPVRRPAREIGRRKNRALPFGNALLCAVIIR